MGSNLDPRKFETWLKRNYWYYSRSNKHDTYYLEVIDDETGSTLLFDTYTFPFHNARKNNAVQDYVVKAVSSKMKIPKEQLIELIREQKDLGEEYISILRKKQ